MPGWKRTKQCTRVAMSGVLAVVDFLSRPGDCSFYGLRLGEEIAMPRISEFYGIAIYVYWRDHAPPHFHAIDGGDDAAIDIASGNVLEGQLPRRAAKMVQLWCDAHRDELLDNWARAQRGEPLMPIAPLD